MRRASNSSGAGRHFRPHDVITHKRARGNPFSCSALTFKLLSIFFLPPSLTHHPFLPPSPSLLLFLPPLLSLRLLSDDAVELCGTPLNALSSHLLKLLQFEPGERDVIFLHHKIGIEWPDKKVIADHSVI